jgi:predicted dehydrogenase/threonine dehydrogenase-like Zn-dependent dehydrogenase
MRQLVQELDTGVLRVVDVPAPMIRPGGVLVRTSHSVISIGTERTKIEFGKKSLVGKARARPDQVKKVLEAVAREGVVSTYRKVRSRLTALSPLGYSAAGVVEAVGEGVSGIRVGDRVACAGAGYANHAERVWIPENLVVPVPDEVPLEAAAFSTLGAIALQGVRQADVRLGERVVVIGLGLLGQLTIQLLRASGVVPIGVDVDVERVALARRAGAIAVLRRDDVEGEVRVATGGIGADAVIITAATSSEDPIRLAGELARDRGRVVVVGAVPINVPRSPYYEKEVEVRLSRSYGPGRYDPEYEEKGHDYPIGYVRWTERRNVGEFLRLLGTGGVDLSSLVTHRFDFESVVEAYDALSGTGGAGALGVVLRYPEVDTPEPRRIELRAAPGRSRAAGERVRVGMIGAGNFATGVLIPALKELGTELSGIVTASGISARSVAEKFGFNYMAGSAEEILADPAIDAVVIATRHNEHARLSAEALRAGKAVFVEKPLALDDAGLDEVLGAARLGGPLMVGFNRRFAPATTFLRERFARAAGARVVHVRANAGFIPPDSWVHDPQSGGGRLIGEGCHFIDLALYLIGSPAVEVTAVALGGDDPAAALQDNVQVTVRAADGSIASILYTAKGDPKSGKERVELFAGGATGVIDDFRSAEYFAGKRERWKGTQDKGHRAELKAFVEAVKRGGEPPIPLAELENASRATLAAARSLVTGRPEAVVALAGRQGEDS